MQDHTSDLCSGDRLRSNVQRCGRRKLSDLYRAEPALAQSAKCRGKQANEHGGKGSRLTNGEGVQTLCEYTISQ